MPVVLPLKKMSRDEKLRAMEALWADLSKDDDCFESPAWHAQALREAERAMKNGKANLAIGRKLRSGFAARQRSLRDASPQAELPMAFGFMSGKAAALVGIFSNHLTLTLNRFDSMWAPSTRTGLSSNALETISVRDLL